MNPWSVTSFENIFSHSVGCLFVCNLLCCAKVFKFNRVPFVYFLLLFPLSRRLVGEGNGNPLQYSCLENPKAEEPVGLQSMGSLRVGHDWATSLSFFTCMHWRRIHSSILAWRIPGTGEPGGQPSMGSHRVRHDWNDLAAAAARGRLFSRNALWILL